MATPTPEIPLPEQVFDASQPLPIIGYKDPENCIDPIYDTCNLADIFTAWWRVAGRGLQDTAPGMFDYIAANSTYQWIFEELERQDPQFIAGAGITVETDALRPAAYLYVAGQNEIPPRTPDEKRAWEILFSDMYVKLRQIAPLADPNITAEQLCI